MEHKEQIYIFLTSYFNVSEPSSLEVGSSLLERNIIDSTGVLEVILL